MQSTEDIMEIEQARVRCRSCSGLMVLEFDSSGVLNEGEAAKRFLHCVDCGALVDWGMLRNRVMQRSGPSQLRRRSSLPLGMRQDAVPPFDL
jgi:hypothetical protein